MLCREQAQVVLDTPLIFMERQSPPAAQSGRRRTSSWWTPKISAGLLLPYRCLAETQVGIHLLVPAHLLLPRKPLLNRCFPFSIIRETSEELHLPCWKTWKSVTCTLDCSCHVSDRGLSGDNLLLKILNSALILFCSVPATSSFFITIV